jgi:hypothetical protein
MVVTAAHCIAVFNNLELTTVLMGQVLAGAMQEAAMHLPQINIAEVEEDYNEVAVESIMIHEDYKTTEDGTVIIRIV